MSAQIARRFGLGVLEPLQEPLLELGEAAVVVLHLIAKQQVADLVHADHVGAGGFTIARWGNVDAGVERHHLRFLLVCHAPPSLLRTNTLGTPVARWPVAVRCSGISCCCMGFPATEKNILFRNHWSTAQSPANQAF